MQLPTTVLNLACGVLMLVAWGHRVAADTPQIDFATQIQPLFERHCYGCHGPQLQESNYRVDVKARALGGGDLEDPPIVVSDSGNSALIRYVSGDDPNLRMPPDGEGQALNAQQVATLASWIDQGAQWPDALAGDEHHGLTTDHWSFQPIADPHPPKTNGRSYANAIDAFVSARLRDRGLSRSPPADRMTLARRLYLDLHGLPPTIAQLRAFVDDPRPDAYDRLVDRVLASPYFGQRWALHWLDVVRFGESTGYEVNRDRPNAYHYRDYVIEAFNQDVAYGDFIVQQIAGDAVGTDAATGFLVAGPYDMVKSPDINLTLMQRQDELADIVNTTGTAFLGLTLGCARCHNHKFDPILQKDYYALQAVFAGVEHGERELQSSLGPNVLDQVQQTESQIAAIQQRIANDRRRAGPPPVGASATAPINRRQNFDYFDPVVVRRLRFVVLATNSSEPCIDELEIYSTDGRNVALATAGGVPSSSGDFPDHPYHKLAHINDGQYGNRHSWISNQVGAGWVQIDFPQPIQIQRVVWGRDREGKFYDRVPHQYRIDVADDGQTWQTVATSDNRPAPSEELEAPDAFIQRLPISDRLSARSALQQLAHLQERREQLKRQIKVGYVGVFKTPDETYRLHRGDPLSPRERVAPDALTVTGSLQLDFATPERERRLALARWIASPDHPLTARVIVNRIWQHHFGRGIVATPSDFGRNGVPPTHPALLDWLARRFLENGGSQKWLHRQIVLSQTYRQSSQPRPKGLDHDADCRWLWRFPPRRLAAEPIRDSVLHVTGMLNNHAGGPGFLLLEIDHENVHHYFPVDQFGPDQFRRMVYMMKIRQEQDDVFGVFDCPDGGQTMPRRGRSTTARQALNLLNSPFMIEQANFFADRLRREAGHQRRAQVALAFRLTFLRDPTQDELTEALELVDHYGLPSLCRALLNANEFLFLN